MRSSGYSEIDFTMLVKSMVLPAEKGLTLSLSTIKCSLYAETHKGENTRHRTLLSKGNGQQHFVYCHVVAYVLLNKT